MNIANGRLNRATVGALSLNRSEQVLDVGFGGGVGTRLALESGAQVIVIDPAPVAVAAGRAAFGDRATVRAGDAVALGEPPGSLDAAFSVNTLYFWADVPEGLRTLHTALRPGGRLAIGIEQPELARRARSRSHLPANSEARAALLTDAGFSGVKLVRPRRRHVVLIARR